VKATRARGKWRGFSPGATARHSLYARVHTDCFSKLPDIYIYIYILVVIHPFSPNFLKSSTTPVFVTSQSSGTRLFRQLAQSEQTSRSLQANVGNLGENKIGCCGRCRKNLGKKLTDQKKTKNWNSPYGLWLSASGMRRIRGWSPSACRAPEEGGDRSARTQSL